MGPVSVKHFKWSHEEKKPTLDSKEKKRIQRGKKQLCKLRFSPYFIIMPKNLRYEICLIKNDKSENFVIKQLARSLLLV